METQLLNNGMQLPKLGFGTYDIKEEYMQKAIVAATEEGISLFDTSPNYKVDVSLGRAFKQIGLKRENLIIVEKVDTEEQLQPIRIALENCLARLQTDYIDLYLIHWPFPGRYVDTWLQMEQLCREGLVKAIGVCNFMPHHLGPLLEKAETVPVVNQIEMHPLFTQHDTVEYCRQHNIAIMAYTPLGRMTPALVHNPLLESLAIKYGKTVPQIILRWDIQSDFVVIPKSQNPARIRENSQLFDFRLSDTDMSAIRALNCDMRLRFDPDDLLRYPQPLPYRLWLKVRRRIQYWAKRTLSK